MQDLGELLDALSDNCCVFAALTVFRYYKGVFNFNWVSHTTSY